MAKNHKTRIFGDELEYDNGDMIVNGKRFEKSYMELQAKRYTGVNRIHKPVPILFWQDCKNGKQSNYALID